MFVFQAQPHLDLNTSARVLSRLCIPNVMTESVPNRPLDYYTCAFRKSKMNRWSLWWKWVTSISAASHNINMFNWNCFFLQVSWLWKPGKLLHKHTEEPGGEYQWLLCSADSGWWIPLSMCSMLTCFTESLVVFNLRCMRFLLGQCTARGRELRSAWTGWWMKACTQQLFLCMR